MNPTLRLVAVGGLVLAYLLMVVCALLPAPVWFLLLTALAVTTELWLRQEPAGLPRLLRGQLGVRFRLLSADVLTAVLAARLLPDRTATVVLAVLAVGALHLGREAAGIFARRYEWRRSGGPVGWLALDVPGLPVPVPPRPVPALDTTFALLTLVLPLGFTVAWFTDRLVPSLVAEIVLLVVVVAYLVWRTVQYVLLNRVSRDAVRAAVRGAVERLGPEIVVHHSGRRGTAEQVLRWVPQLQRLGRPVLVVVREHTHLELLDGCGLPVVFAPRSQDVELFMVPSVQVALYPSNATNINNHLLRVPGIYDVLIGHGDSDEQENRSPVARMYDEVWVEGRLGRERYAYAASGVPQQRIVEVGTPAGPAPVPLPPSDDPRPVVLYAPAWEHVVDATNTSSLLEHGEAVLDALLARQDVRVLLAPARPTGSRRSDLRETLAAMRRRIELAGLGHAVIEPEQVHAALAVAVFAVVDVSPVLSAAILADVPVGVVALGDADEAGMREAFPSLLGATVLEDLPADVFDALDDAQGADRAVLPRRATAARISTVHGAEASERFAAAIEQAIAAQGRRRAFARPASAR